MNRREFISLLGSVAALCVTAAPGVAISSELKVLSGSGVQLSVVRHSGDHAFPVQFVTGAA